MTATVQQVREFVRRAHAGQTDRLGRDYVRDHLEPVAAELAAYGADAEMAGLLHDVLEDTAVTAGELSGLGVPEQVVRAVEAVTRRPGEEYSAAIARAAADPLGRLVKLADNTVNLRSNAALAAVDPVAARRLRAKYEAARVRLLQAAPDQAPERDRPLPPPGSAAPVPPGKCPAQPGEVVVGSGGADGEK